MTQQTQTLSAHDPAALDVANMTAIDLCRLGASAKANEDRETARVITAELQKRYHAGTLNAEINAPQAGKIIVEQRGHIEAMKEEIKYLRLKLEAANQELHELRTRRDRMPEPNWQHAPPGSNWWAMDRNGDAYWYKNEPEIWPVMSEWKVGLIEDDAAVLDDSCQFAGWETSLRKRPAPMI